jgi:hypothetical protein
MCDKQIKRSVILVLMIVSLVVPGLNGFAGENGKPARTGKIIGKLIDKYTQQPMPGADVALTGTNLVTVSNERGEFVFNEVPVGGYSLTFSYPEMVPQVKTDIIVKSNQTTFVSASFELIRQADETVSVTAGYFSQSSDEPVSTVSFSNEEIRRAPGAGGDVSRIIASLPSIARVSDQSNTLAVRGGSASENLFLVDNIQIPNINHFPSMGASGGAMSLLNVDFISDVNFYAGGFSAIYGDRLSSVMDLTFREGNREKFGGQLYLDFGGAGMQAEGPLFGKKGAWMFAAKRSYLDLLTKMLDAGATVGYSDFQGKAVVELSSRSKLTFLGVMGIDKSDVTREDAVDVGEVFYGENRSREHTLGMNWFYMWSDKGYSNTSISHSYTKFDYDYLKTVTGSTMLTNISTEESWHFRNVNNYVFNQSHSLRFGVEAHHISSNYDYFKAATTDPLGNPIPDTWKKIDTGAQKYAGFFEYSMKPVSRLTLNIGVRTDYFSYNKNFTVSPRFSAAYQVSGKTSVSASAGIFRQNLPLLLLYQNEANRELKDPVTYQYSLGLTHMLTDDTRLTVEGYYKSYRQFPIDPTQPILCVLDDVMGQSMFGDNALVDSGRARSYGVEFVLQKKLKEKLYGMVSGALYRTQYEGMDGVWRNRVFDNRYIFSIQGGYKPNRKWEYSLKWVIAGGMPYTPFDMEASRKLSSGIFDESGINAERLPAYHSLNLRVDRRYYFSGSNLTLYFSVWNAYNRENVASYYWNEVENKPDFSKQFSILPVIGVEYEF